MITTQELSILKAVLDQPGGACEQILADHTKASKLESIITAVNSGDNLAFLIKQVETQKTVYTQAFLAKDRTQLSNPAFPFAFLGVKNYLDQTRRRSLQVAQSLDKLITKEFGNHAGVLAAWNSYLQQVDAQASQSISSFQAIQKAEKDKM
jgi:thiamine kinase-like enzyme